MASRVFNLLTPHSSDRFHARNNQFQMNGTKGFFEVQILDKNHLYWRLDLPGVSKERFLYAIDKEKKLISIEGEALKESEHEEGGRSYGASFTLVCNCCEISNVKHDVRDRVLRMTLQKVRIKDAQRECYQGDGNEVPDEIENLHSDGSGRAVEDRPYLLKGSREAFESILTENGGLFLRVDMPGVAEEDARVCVVGGNVIFFGKALKVMEHDSSGREYLGSVSLLPMTPIEGNIEHAMKDGVFRLSISPV
ncbi:putative 57 kDa heat shock protein [Hevea brasiliensis]|uniref:putative 57 kDa heat shock protein n=1 Tax=Hevea brasiliensis TaxID=3981 RepID=UPI0025E8DDDA|nr:putative 57 kDa heat shock protein [Hevea brasiliensis]